MNKLIERLRKEHTRWKGNSSDAVREAIKALEAADAMASNAQDIIDKVIKDRKGTDDWFDLVEIELFLREALKAYRAATGEAHD